METQNATSTDGKSAADIGRDASAVQPDLAAEAAPGAIATAPTETDGTATGATIADPTTMEPKPSYVKLAMRNMVRKRGLSLWHFTLTTIGLLTFLVGLSYLTR